MKNDFLFLDVNDLINEQKSCIDSNDSYGSLIAVCSYFEFVALEKKIKLIERIHNIDGHLTDEVKAIREVYQKQVIEMIKEFKSDMVTEAELKEIKHYL